MGTPSTGAGGNGNTGGVGSTGSISVSCESDASGGADAPLFLTTPEEVAALAALDCEVIRRDVGIAGAELTSLAGLEHTRVIEGSLSVYFSSGLTDFDGFNGLEAVHGDLYLEHAPKLTSLSGLEALESVGGSLVLITDSLPTLSGLDALELIGGSLTITDNQLLTSIEALVGTTLGEGGLYIKNNPRLTTLEGLEKLETLSRVTIDGANGLVDLTGLSGLRTVEGALTIQRTQLRSLAGLESLDAFEEFIIDENDQLITLEGLGDPQDAGRIVITNNPSLTDTEGLSELSEVSTLELRGNAKLHSISAPELRGVGAQLSITHNHTHAESPETLTIDFPRLETVATHLQIDANQNLELLSFPALVGLETDGYVLIARNTGPFTMDFSSLVDTSVMVAENPDLLSLDGFDALFPSAIVQVWDNPYVPQCEVEIGRAHV